MAKVNPVFVLYISFHCLQILVLHVGYIEFFWLGFILCRWFLCTRTSRSKCIMVGWKRMQQCLTQNGFYLEMISCNVINQWEILSTYWDDHTWNGQHDWIVTHYMYNHLNNHNLIIPNDIRLHQSLLRIGKEIRIMCAILMKKKVSQSVSLQSIYYLYTDENAAEIYL